MGAFLSGIGRDSGGQRDKKDEKWMNVGRPKGPKGGYKNEDWEVNGRRRWA